jgi:hypothetical protein
MQEGVRWLRLQPIVAEMKDLVRWRFPASAAVPVKDAPIWPIHTALNGAPQEHEVFGFCRVFPCVIVGFLPNRGNEFVDFVVVLGVAEHDAKRGEACEDLPKVLEKRMLAPLVFVLDDDGR